MKTILTFLLFAAALPTLAAPVVQVDAIQMPAWVERSGVRQPLATGQALNSGDKVLTGKDARVLLKLSEGSLVRIGPNAQLDVNTLPQPKADVFTAAFDMLRGAFRLSTNAEAKHRARDVSFKVASVTIGIRGTHVFGKAAPDKDIVCLLEGRIDVAHGEKNFVMDGEKLFYIAPKDKPAAPVGPVPAAKLTEWTEETEIQLNSGAQRAGGKWRVYAGRFDNQQDALALYDQLRNAGYNARIAPLSRKGGTVYRVRLNDLPNRGEADALAQKLAAEFQIAAPKVSR
jgi:hypothetical protein